MPEYEYANFRRVSYESGAQFIPVCEKCHRFVKADKSIKHNDAVGLHPGPNATCKVHGRTRMIFEGFL